MYFSDIEATDGLLPSSPWWWWWWCLLVMWSTRITAAPPLIFRDTLFSEHFTTSKIRSALRMRHRPSAHTLQDVTTVPIRNIYLGLLTVNSRSRSRSLHVVVRPSVVCLSVTFVRPTQSQAIEIFGNFSTPFGTLAFCWHLGRPAMGVTWVCVHD